MHDRAYAAATWVLPTPRIPVTARTTDTPGPAARSAASKSARGWNAGGGCGTSPVTTCPGAGTGGGWIRFWM